MTAHLPASAHGWGHRPHLDGLRTVAVYLVVLFHSGAAKFAGGFIGVDLFFVLSGFLVTNVILSDIAEVGHLRLSRFYARRARRLIPAAAVAVAGTALGGFLMTAPLDRHTLVNDGRAASLWYANWHFIAESKEYFNVDAEESPFLHFWSLAIEEQFYLVFPVLVLALWWATRHHVGRLAGAFGAITVVLVGVQLWWASRDTNHAYLGTDARAYQLLAGATFAVLLWWAGLPKRLHRPFAVAFPVAVGALVLLGTSWLDLTPSHRGLAAAAVSLLVILGGEAAGAGSPTTRALSLRPVRYLGAISYGTYLWHWPVVVLTKRVVDATPFALFVLSAAIGTALAALSYELVEQPVRRSATLGRFPRPVIAGGVALAVVTGTMVAPALLDTDRPAAIAAPTRIGGGVEPVPDVDWDAVRADIPSVPRCAEPDGSDCSYADAPAGDPDGPVVLMIGDSHMEMFVPVLRTSIEDHGGRVAAAISGSCPWPRTVYTGRVGGERTDLCIARRSLVYDQQLEALDPDIVVVTSRSREPDANLQATSTRDDLAGADPDTVLRVTATDTIDALLQSDRLVVLVEPVPEVADDQLECLSGAQYVEQCVFPVMSLGREDALYRELAAERDGVVTLDIDDLVCPGLQLCPPIIDGVVVRRDSNHLTQEFLASLQPEIEARLLELGVIE